MHENEPILIFDGVCSFCSATVQFILKNDVRGHIRFAPIQSPLGRKLMTRHGLEPDDAQSLLFVKGDRAYVRSDAAFAIARDLSWKWRWIRVFRFVPRFIRNRVYDLVARNRYRWFGKLDSCFVPAPEVRARFLDEGRGHRSLGGHVASRQDSPSPPSPIPTADEARRPGA